jgi:hypothetical protein
VKPNVSDMVIVHADVYNGTREHPAVVTRVWGDVDTKDGPVTVNLTMFPDGGGEPQFFSSIQLFNDRATAHKQAPGRRVAFWA